MSMNMTVEQILAQTRSMIQTKQASFKKRSDEATSNPPESIGNMSAVGEDAKKTTPKQRSDEEDRNVNETSGRTTAGAKHPDKGREQAVDATESVLTPEKKPAQSDDANAKKASSELANDLLSMIRGYQNTAVKQAQFGPGQPGVNPFAAPVAAVPEKKEPEAGESEKHEKSESKCKEKKEDECEDKGKKEATASDELELTRDVLAKLAALMVSSDEGKALANAVMAKEAGVEAAQELMQFVTTKQAEADYARGQADAQAAVQQQIFKAGYDAAMNKIAAAHQAGQISAEDVEYIKLGQAIADQGAADLQGAMAGGDMGGGMPPEAMAAAGAEGGAGEEISMEDLAAAIDQLVSSGVIQPQEAEQIMQYLASAGGGEGAAPEAEAPAPEAAPEAAEPASEVGEKEGYAKKINKLANALAVNIGMAKAAARK